ncbi:hypothetical protein CFR73_09605 [Novacetimonas maltaceti]|nr:hypothetical protein CFR73_09605 [Novacetimonas maltaceti]
MQPPTGLAFIYQKAVGYDESDLSSAASLRKKYRNFIIYLADTRRIKLLSVKGGILAGICLHMHMVGVPMKTIDTAIPLLDEHADVLMHIGSNQYDKRALTMHIRNYSLFGDIVASVSLTHGTETLSPCKLDELPAISEQSIRLDGLVGVFLRSA